MKHTLSLFFMLIALMSCEKNNVTTQFTPCVHDPDVRRSNESVTDFPATVHVLIINNKQVGYQMLLSDGPNFDGSNRVPWGPCNLPHQYQKDSLKVTVSGYYLTSPSLELANVTPLPFELTAIELRKYHHFNC